MRQTPFAMMLIGILVFLCALVVGSAFGYTSTLSHQYAQRAAQLAAERMSREELARVFEVPLDSKATPQESLNYRFGLSLSSGTLVPAYNLFIMALGAGFAIWGFTESQARRRKQTLSEERRRAEQCVACGYSFKATPCPECGHV